jgi:hypothetical protein
MRRLFGGRDYIDAMRRLMEARVAPPSSLCAAVSPELDAVVLKMLAGDPSDRFGSCEDVLAALGPLGRAQGGDAATLRAYLEALDPIETRQEATASMQQPFAARSTPEPPTVSALRRRRPSLRRTRARAVWALGALLLIAAGSGTGIMLAHHNPNATERTPRPVAAKAPAALSPATASLRPLASADAPTVPIAARPRRPRHGRVVPDGRPTPLGRTYQEDDIKDPFDR